MTKKDDKQHDQDLQKKLEKIIKEKSDLESGKEEKEKIKNKSDHKTSDIQFLKLQIEKLEKEKEEIIEMTKRAQYDYINLKTDFDRFVRQTEDKNQTLSLDVLFEIVKKFLPFLEDLRKSLENIPKEKNDDPLAKGVQIIYDNFIKTLEAMNIYPIISIGETPDTFYHEPVSTIQTENKDMKGKIVQEFSRGFFYKKDGNTKIISTSKVVIGA